ncbi:MAG: D-aminoacyl-tRNA deacylase [Saprospiraceae bacterium]
MKAVIQRVSSAHVMVDGNTTASIEKGLLVLIGIEHTDDRDDAIWLSNKIIMMRIFEDSEGKMNMALREIAGEIIVVSQFTLHASTKKGNRPSFIKAARPEHAIPLYEFFLEQLEVEGGKKIQSGIFGADMKVSLINDGPVTIIIDSKAKE